MSDFDKEAEREKLREKYGKEEEQRREATEQMSELLLQGATMTNAHCSDCGDPIFRYDGTEFCPTCEKRVDRDTGAGAADEGAESGAADADAGSEADADDGSREDAAPDPQTVEVTSPDDDARVKFGGPAGERPDHADESTADANAAENSADATASRSDATETGSEPSTDERTDSPADPTASTGTEPGGTAGADPSASGGTERAATAADAPVRSSDRPTAADRVPSLRPGSGDAGSAPSAHATGSNDVDAAASESLQQARRTLAATVERFSRRALETDSPREAREYLETAREAAATLEATEF